MSAEPAVVCDVRLRKDSLQNPPGAFSGESSQIAILGLPGEKQRHIRKQLVPAKQPSQVAIECAMEGRKHRNPARGAIVSFQVRGADSDLVYDGPVSNDVSNLERKALANPEAAQPLRGD